MRPVSLRSTMRTLPNAPFPTTRSRRKWLRLTWSVKTTAESQQCRGSWGAAGRLTRLPRLIAHCRVVMAPVELVRWALKASTGSEAGAGGRGAAARETKAGEGRGGQRARVGGEGAGSAEGERAAVYLECPA